MCRIGWREPSRRRPSVGVIPPSPQRGRQQPAGEEDRADRRGDVTSIPDLTRLLAWIAEWQEGHGKPGGRAEAARRLDEAHKLLEEVHNMLTEMRREMLGPATRGRA